MSARTLFLGLDVGTQGTKGLVLDGATGAVLARASRAHGLIEGLPPGAAEQHPQTWIEAIGAVARELWRALEPAPAELAGIGVSGQQHGLVVLDAALEVVRPAKLWCDTTSAAEAVELSKFAGRAIPSGFTAPKVLWLKRHEPEHWRRTRHVLLPHEYVNARLCGERRAEYGDASGTGWFDVRTRTWDEALLAHIDADLRVRLPELLEPGALAGRLNAAGAQLLGLTPAFAGVPLAAGGGDNMQGAIGAGATEPGVAVVSLGTSATVCTYSDTAIIDESGAIAAFCDSTGGWLPLLCTMNATAVLHEVAQGFGRELEELCTAAARVPPGCGGVRFMPFLVGERVPDLPHARGVIEGLAVGSLQPAVLMRAALEGVTFNLALGVERLRALGPRIECVRAVGGGARNRLWLELLAASLGARVECPLELDSAAVGAALQARWSLERLQDPSRSAHASAAQSAPVLGAVIEPDPALASACAGLLEGFRRARTRLWGQ